MSRPAVTVCIPTYNYAHYLGGAIASVLDQTFADFELLIADDVSSDDTADVVEPFLADPRVRFMPNAVNSGMFANFNRCIDVAEGRYIKFLMADDWLRPDFLERMVALLDTHEEVDFATSGGWLIDDDGEVFGEELQRLGDGPVVPRKRVVAESMIGFNVVGMPTNTLVRTEALRRAGGFDAAYAPSADVVLWMRLLGESDLGWVPDRLSYLRIHGAHTHDWGADPNPIDFKVWHDAPALAPGTVSAAAAKTAQQRWSVRYLAFAIKRAMRGELRAAHSLWQTASENIGAGRAVFEFVRAMPRLVRDRVVTTLVRASGRSIVYSPYPNRGRPLPEVAAEAEAAKGEGLRRESVARTPR